MIINSEQEFDAIVIGSGAGGCAAAYTLVQSGLRVALIEKGTALPHDGSTLDIEKVVQQGQFRSHETWRDGRGQRFAPEEYFNIGGKTKWYGAALLRYAAEEFDADAAHQCRGWPISRADLTPFYDIATQQLGIREFACEPDLARITSTLTRRSPQWHSEALPLGLAADILDTREEASHFDGFASPTDAKSDAETAFLGYVRHAPSLTLFEGVAALDLLPHPDDVARIAGVSLADQRIVKGRCVLLAAGALHSPRLLQRYLERHQLADRSPGFTEIGRNLKLHLLTAVIAVSPSVKTDLIRKTRILLHSGLPHSSVQPLGFDGELIATLFPKWISRPAARMLGHRSYGFFLQTEDGSHRDNRVVEAPLSNVDGVLPQMDYDATRLRPALTEHRLLVRRFRAALLRAGMLAFSRRIGIAGTAHVNGTLIAGEDPRNSVVDAEGKVHGLQSLYVVDASVLPRSSRVNPSLTIYAWSLRAASLLSKRLVASKPSSAALCL